MHENTTKLMLLARIAYSVYMDRGNRDHAPRSAHICAIAAELIATLKIS